MNRDEAVKVMTELLTNCPEMDNIYLCMVPPTASTPIVTSGYQIHIRSIHPFDKDTGMCIEGLTKKYGLSAQAMESEEKMIIYRKH